MNPVVRQQARAMVATPILSEPSVGPDRAATLNFPHLHIGHTNQTDRLCRILNVAVAGVALVILALPMVIIALLVMFTSPGPVLYTQTRVGVNRRRNNSVDGRRRVNYGGRLFKIYKFRTMHRGADSKGEVWARPDDPRVTRVGRFLRKSRLDELPQLFNVLKGDMNVVGPRPEQPKIFTRLRNEIDLYEERQRVLPGITGLAQVCQHYDHSIEDVRKKLLFDLQYIADRSWQTDVKVLLQTVPVVIFQRGAW
jgi:lipopolysaccharide/colanic/teichoic acid biosynthesis glycosyltransferase